MLQEIDVTFGTTASQSHARIDANPALMAALAVTVIAAATLAGAWFFQLVLDIRPCPLCLEQRYAYYLALPLGFVVAFAASQIASYFQYSCQAPALPIVDFPAPARSQQ